jgi:hypothetical protein
VVCRYGTAGVTVKRNSPEKRVPWLPYVREVSPIEGNIVDGSADRPEPLPILTIEESAAVSALVAFATATESLARVRPAWGHPQVVREDTQAAMDDARRLILRARVRARHPAYRPSDEEA